jgi:uncharacterized membrane protein YeaQ/YmgE (transglycosylase-associated protein family)
VNTIVWILAGGALAWLAFAFFNLNRERGLFIALIIGAMGAYFGGTIIAPALGQTMPAGSSIGALALAIAAATAAACVFVGDMMYERFGV